MSEYKKRSVLKSRKAAPRFQYPLKADVDQSQKRSIKVDEIDEEVEKFDEEEDDCERKCKCLLLAKSSQVSEDGKNKFERKRSDKDEVKDKRSLTPSTSAPTSQKNNPSEGDGLEDKKSRMASRLMVTPRRFRLPSSCAHYDKEDTNIRFYSKYLTRYEISGIAYAIHRLLHNYAMFRCHDTKRAQTIFNEELLENITRGIEAFFKTAYMYDPWYQPITFKKMFNYLEVHIKIGIGDKFLKEDSRNMILKVFLVIFFRGRVRFVLTKTREPSNLKEDIYLETIKNNWENTWTRVDFISTCVKPKYRKVSSIELNRLYSTLINEEHAISKGRNARDLWTCIDFDSPAEDWNNEVSDFYSVIRKETSPYRDKNLLDVHPQELTAECNRERKIHNQ